MSKRPNILFIPVDDLRPELCCYGQTHVVSPNIDRLAQEGVVFTQAYCQVPVCGATRASLLTGVRPSRDRFVTYKTRVEDDLPGALTMPEHFRNHGYNTVSVGKVFHHIRDTSDRSWSIPAWYPSIDRFWQNYQTPENQKLADARTGRGPAFESAEVPDDAYFDGKIADRAIEHLRQLASEEEPFFLAAGFVKPHLPFNAPKKYWDYYRFNDIDLANNMYRPDNAPDVAMHDWGELRSYYGIPEKGPLDEQTARMLRHGYFAATSYTDAQVGKLLDELDRLGLSENTIVVLWGDHGWQLGEHSLWCKHCNFDTSLNAPLIVKVPGLGENQSRSLVEFVDVYPTLCELTGLPLPDHLEGSSFVPVLHDPQRPWKAGAFSRYFSGDSIRTERYLYTEWTDDDGSVTARMLYDHELDSAENENISERPENADLVASLSQQLRRGWQDCRR